MKLWKMTRRHMKRMRRWIQDLQSQKPSPQAPPATDVSEPEKMQGLRSEQPDPRYLMSCDIRTDFHIPGKTSDHYCSDKSRTIEYHFNSAGYRSEELDPEAKFIICVVGESNAVGTGVAFDSTFGQRFKFHYCEALGLPLESVNVINLAVFGASADYCVRTVIRQLDGIRPHLVIARFPKWDRVERLNADLAASYTLTALNLDKLKEAPNDVLGFCHYYTENIGRMNIVKNALLLQSICQIRNLDFIISSKGLESDCFRKLIANQLYVHLDQSNLDLYYIPAKHQDKGADGNHWGPRTHDAHAIALLGKFAAIKSQERESGWMSKASQITSYVMGTRAVNVVAAKKNNNITDP